MATERIDPSRSTTRTELAPPPVFPEACVSPCGSVGVKEPFFLFNAISLHEDSRSSIQVGEESRASRLASGRGNKKWGGVMRGSRRVC